jgi:hypothetical protein
MSFHRASMICGLVLGMATFVGCQQEEEVQPPPPPPPASELEANAKKTSSARGSSSIKKGMGSESLTPPPAQ